MALVKSALKSQLEQLLDSGKPATVADAASQWALAYASYGAAAMSGMGALATTAMANLGILQGAFSAAFGSQTSSGAASAIAGGVSAFWQAMVWVGPASSGVTASPGNFSLSSSLGSIFADTNEKSAADKAVEIADAFDAGAKQVVVSDIPYVQPSPPVPAPIN